MKKATLRVLRFGRAPCTKWAIRGLIFTLVFLGALMSLRAEIYKWQDETGTIRYSNHPPDDPARILETIPTEQVPMVQDTDGVMYYLNVPAQDGPAGDAKLTDIEPMTLSPDMLNQVLQQTSSPNSAIDLTALTLRLSELERALQQETRQRLRWEQQYDAAQTRIATLETQNGRLKSSLTQVERKLTTLQNTPTVSDIPAALPPEQTDQLLAMLDAKAESVYKYVESTVRQADQRVVQLQAELQDLERRYAQKLGALETDFQNVEWQQQPAYEVRVKLASLETELQELVDALPASRRASEVVSELRENDGALQTVVDYQARQLNQQQHVIEQLSADLEQLKGQAAEAGNAQLMQTTEAEAPLEDLTADELRRMIAELSEKNAFMEAVIKHQANALNAQQARLAAIEEQVAGLSAAEAGQQNTSAIATVSDFDLILGYSSSGIEIVERRERRKSEEAAGGRWWNW